MNMMDTTIDLTQKTGLLHIQLPTVNIQVVIQANNHQLLISPIIENLAVDVLAGALGATGFIGEVNFAYESFSYIASESSGTIVKVADASEPVLESITGEIPREVSTNLSTTVAEVTVEDLIIASDVPAITSESIPTLLPITSIAESPFEVSTKRPACSNSDDNHLRTSKKQTTERNSRTIEEEKVTEQEEITPRALLAELKTVIRQRRVVDPFDPVSFFLIYNFDIHCFNTAVQDFIAYKRVIRKERLFERTFL